MDTVEHKSDEDELEAAPEAGEDDDGGNEVELELEDDDRDEFEDPEDGRSRVGSFAFTARDPNAACSPRGNDCIACDWSCTPCNESQSRGKNESHYLREKRRKKEHDTKR